jgi:methylene-tetrahydromethanopterin dehydrogenase
MYINHLIFLYSEAAKMKTLEITPLKDKKLTVFIVEKEYNEPFWIIEPPQSRHSRMLHSLFRPSIGFYRFLEDMSKEVKQDFVTEELGMRSEKEFYEENILAQLFTKNGVPFFPVDIDGAARAYLETSLDKKRELRDSVLKTLTTSSKQKAQDSLESEYLVAYGQCLQLEIEEQEHEAAFSTRENWIVMGILEHAKEFDSKKEITCVHIGSPEHVNRIASILESLDVRVETVKLSKKIVSNYVEASGAEGLASLLQSMQIQVKPVVKRSSDNAPYLLFYLDTDEKASPFDICMAYDTGYNAVVPYENVTPEDGRRIVQDALFSRGPKGVKHTCFFIGGKNSEKAEEVFEAVKGTMFSPFKTSIIVDPGGAYTTAAAMVAKVEHALVSQKLGGLKEKTCAVLGTGAVGQTAAVLLAKLGCNVMIVSLNPGRTDGKEHAENIAERLAKRHGVKVEGAYAPTQTEKLEILKRADVILCAGTRGVRIIDKELFKDLKLAKVVVDINAIRPSGVEGLELKDDMREIASGIFGIGALTVGDLKYRLEREILKEARVDGDEIYNYNPALLLARKLLQKEISLAKLTLTLSYPPSRKSSK